MKKYIKPITAISELTTNIVCSSGTKPGHGHGDNNHDHVGPPGHNKSYEPYPIFWE